MGTITIKVKKSRLNSLIKKTNFNNGGGSFITYQFIAMCFYTEKDNIASFYESTQVSQNSWTNYAGEKIWNNGNEAKCTKSEVLECICRDIKDICSNIEHDYKHREKKIKFEFIGF